jgi:hypothetical protein
MIELATSATALMLDVEFAAAISAPTSVIGQSAEQIDIGGA